MADAACVLVRLDSTGQNPVVLANSAIGGNGPFLDQYVDHPPYAGTWIYVIQAVPGAMAGNPSFTDAVVGRTSITALSCKR